MENVFNIYPLGEHAFTIQFGDTISSVTHQMVLGLFHSLQHQPLPGTIDLVPAYTTLTIIFDSFTNTLEKELLTLASLQGLITQRLQLLPQTSCSKQRRLTVPVCYHPSLAPDLQYVADLHQLTIEQLVHLHTAITYNVYMIGFLPGFPYMGIVDHRIVTARKKEPRKKVEAGSVGIAGNQTGIYPFASPGGWQIIGRTPLRVFDTSHEEPAFFTPGDEVVFYPISLDEYNQQKQP